MTLAIEIVGLIFMLTILFIGIWGFVLMIKIYNQLKYRNYILEKLSLNVYSIASKGINVSKDESSSSVEEMNSVVSNIKELRK